MPEVVTDGGASFGNVKQYSPVHHDAVTSVAAIAPGVCLSGSKDKVHTTNVLILGFKPGLKMDQLSKGEGNCCPSNQKTYIIYTAKLFD